MGNRGVGRPRQVTSLESWFPLHKNRANNPTYLMEHYDFDWICKNSMGSIDVLYSLTLLFG